MKKEIDFILSEDREILGSFVSIGVPFRIEQEQVDNATVTTYLFDKYGEPGKTLSFSVVSRNGQANMDFDEELIDDIPLWMKGVETPGRLDAYIRYRTGSSLSED